MSWFSSIANAVSETVAPVTEEFREAITVNEVSSEFESDAEEAAPIDQSNGQQTASTSWQGMMSMVHSVSNVVSEFKDALQEENQEEESDNEVHDDSMINLEESNSMEDYVSEMKFHDESLIAEGPSLVSSHNSVDFDQLPSTAPHPIPKSNVNVLLEVQNVSEKKNEEQETSQLEPQTRNQVPTQVDEGFESLTTIEIDPFLAESKVISQSMALDSNVGESIESDFEGKEFAESTGINPSFSDSIEPDIETKGFGVSTASDAIFVESNVLPMESDVRVKQDADLHLPEISSEGNESDQLPNNDTLSVSVEETVQNEYEPIHEAAAPSDFHEIISELNPSEFVETALESQISSFPIEQLEVEQTRDEVDLCEVVSEVCGKNESDTEMKPMFNDHDKEMQTLKTELALLKDLCVTLQTEKEEREFQHERDMVNLNNKLQLSIQSASEMESQFRKIIQDGEEECTLLRERLTRNGNQILERDSEASTQLAKEIEFRVSLEREFHTALEQVKKENQELRQKNQQAETELAVASNQALEVSQHAQSLEALVASVEKKCEVLEVEKSEIQLEMSKVQSTLLRITNELERAETQLRTKVQSLKTQLAESQAQCEHANAQASEREFGLKQEMNRLREGFQRQEVVQAEQMQERFTSLSLLVHDTLCDVFPSSSRFPRNQVQALQKLSQSLHWPKDSPLSQLMPTEEQSPQQQPPSPLKAGTNEKRKAKFITTAAATRLVERGETFDSVFRKAFLEKSMVENPAPPAPPQISSFSSQNQQV